MVAFDPTIDLNRLQKMMVGGGLDVTIKSVEVLNVIEQTSYTPCITNEKDALVKLGTEKSLDVVADIILDCGGKYEIDTAVAYSCRKMPVEGDGIQGVIDAIKNGSFGYQFDNENLNNDMSCNICINSNDVEVLDAIFAMQSEGFESGGENREGVTTILFDHIAANRGVYFLGLALNKSQSKLLDGAEGFNQNLLTELDRRIREAALELLSKPAI
jgi:hypothetical protein